MKRRAALRRIALATVMVSVSAARTTRLTFVNGIGYGTFQKKDNVGYYAICLRVCLLGHWLLDSPHPMFFVVMQHQAFSHIDAEQKVISDLFGGKKCEFCHNPTSKKHEQDTVGYLGDLTQAGTQKLGRNTPEVEVLVK